MSEDTIPRRARLDLNTNEELLISSVIHEIEMMPADVRLTNVISKLTEAKKLLSDYIDDIKPEDKPLTLGQKRILKSFNPSADPTVERFKDLGAEMIDILESLRGDKNSDGKSPEGQRNVSVAQTEIEGATMWAVKAIFVK